jgi:hypothetical protein
MEWLRKKATEVLLTVAGAVVMLQLIVPPVFDFIFDLVMLALVGIASFINKSGTPKK